MNMLPIGVSFWLLLIRFCLVFLKMYSLNTTLYKLFIALIMLKGLIGYIFLIYNCNVFKKINFQTLCPRIQQKKTNLRFFLKLLYKFHISYYLLPSDNLGLPFLFSFIFLSSEYFSIYYFV